MGKESIKKTRPKKIRCTCCGKLKHNDHRDFWEDRGAKWGCSQPCKDCGAGNLTSEQKIQTKIDWRKARIDSIESQINKLHRQLANEKRELILLNKKGI